MAPTGENGGIYHPQCEGPLTIECLREIVSRRYYKEHGFTMLIVAAYVGSVLLVQRLINEAIEVNLRDKLGRSALWWAAHGWGGHRFTKWMAFQLWQCIDFKTSNIGLVGVGFILIVVADVALEKRERDKQEAGHSKVSTSFQWE